MREGICTSDGGSRCTALAPAIATWPGPNCGLSVIHEGLSGEDVGHDD